MTAGKRQCAWGSTKPVSKQQQNKNQTNSQHKGFENFEKLVHFMLMTLCFQKLHFSTTQHEVYYSIKKIYFLC